MQKIASFLIHKHGLHDSFYIANMGLLNKKIAEWRSELPNVKPFYAIKCNPDREIVKTMLYNNMGFDCASKVEIDNVIQAGGQPHNIIFAHPVKKTKELLYASNIGIKYTTFDSKSEIDKMAKYSPLMKAVIRLKINNPNARVQLGMKYGAAYNEYKGLLDYARQCNINIVGTSFHVGSVSGDPSVFSQAVNYSSDVFHYAKTIGYDMHLLDIGGGFTGSTFKDAARVLRPSLAYFLYEHNGSITIIAEPGRYFAEEIFTFFTPVIGQRKRGDIREYWLSDGLYGSFNCILYDGQTPTFKILRNPNHPIVEKKETYKTIFQGSTCDTFDKITNTPILIPELRNGDFVQIDNFGAYTLSGAKDFNGINMSNPKIFYINDV